MKLRELERILEGLEGIPAPRPDLEQYSTPAVVAARLVYHALMRGDIQGRRVCDLGCGSGILACGAALLGAAHVLGVEIDSGAIAVARRNADRIGEEIEFRIGDITRDEVFGQYVCDTVMMNPPFGAQRKHADRPFLDRALSLGSKIYGIYNAGSLPFVASYTAGRAVVEEVIRGTFPLRRIFTFHTRERKEIEVEMICLRRIA